MPGIAVTDGVLEVSNVDAGDRLISELQVLSEDFATEVEGWQIDQVRARLRTDRYFHGVYFPKAFQIDGRKYVHGLAELATRAGARIFEDTPVVGIDASGIRKRIVTPSARLRASHIVLAGNVHLGAPSRRLSETLLPVWRYAGITEPLGDRLSDVIAFKGSVIDTDGIDQFRIVEGGRLMWASPETTWDARPRRQAVGIARRIRTIFPQLGRVQIEDVWGGATGQTVHGMPQVGQLRRGLWVASGFGRQGLATSAMAGQLIARSILWGDERWRLFSPFELVWAGGITGRAAGHLIGLWERGSSAAAGALARYRERLRDQERIREARLAEANRLAGTRPMRPQPPPGQPGPRPQRSPQPAEHPEAPVVAGPGERSV
jgi:glycine/D-amino acid oxidase-like deaminating enzyme